MVAQERGLTSQEAARRLTDAGPNVLHAGGVRPWRVFLRQLNNPLLLLLGATALASIFFGQGTDALVILVISAMSVGLGFINEYRAERAIEDLHARVRRKTIAIRDDKPVSIDVAAVVAGDLILLGVGDIIPADLRLTQAQGLESDESILTGESLPVQKQPNSMAFMGTIVKEGTARGIVVCTGAATALGRIADQLAGQLPQTAFQKGLRQFSTLLIVVTAAFSGIVFAINLVLHHPLFESLLFALAIAVAITPQLLPAIVTISLSRGARQMARRSVVVKRLVSIEDLGNVELLFTDKTGTITEGEIRLESATDLDGKESLAVLKLGLLCNAAIIQGGAVVGSSNSLDSAIWQHVLASRVPLDDSKVIGQAPFDYVRRRMSVLVEDQRGERTLITKGAPESVLSCCLAVPASARDMLEQRFANGERVIAVATRAAPGAAGITPADEYGLTLVGFLSFRDPPKPDAADALGRLNALGIEVKIATGDNERVAQKICRDLRFSVGGTLTGDELAQLADTELVRRIPATTIFARITPEQKSRLIRASQSLGKDVGFLGDGINDAVALHYADVGISVDSAADVAKDAADIVLLEKDLHILADGVMVGRRVFANTIKYILMGTSSNFGNMISTGTASLFLPFLPMLPSQILLNNILYDTSEMTIPTDNVDLELLQRPAHWDMGLIRRFMMLFGTLNACFDFSIFAIMLFVFHAGELLFRSGFFIESFITQTLIIFAIRTRRIPFLKSRPSTPLIITTLAATVIGAALPFSPLARFFGFAPLPAAFFIMIMAVILTVYFVLVEFAKAMFWKHAVSNAVEKV
ncbi:MAG TPA: magnesium-translocating P-type ATPase [Candidatus Eremiobacteraceae bacterium]|nr:magnesium-translocating P-type ATPase [Candidatus Eremiobacteraceae bacterium]